MVGKNMQNLTARYNILYNARILIEESERNILASYRDNFDRLLPVFREPSAELAQPELKNLDRVIGKMNVIVNEKAQSKYVDDAYFLIAKANHLKSEYFTSAEFFDYVFKTYPQDNEKKQASLVWKARALIRLNRLDEARVAIDTALKNIDSEKKSVPDIYAVAAQLSIYDNDDPAAIEFLKRSIKATGNKGNRLRWQYLLGQLQEVTGNPEAAYESYTAVVKSNAAFDMAFNAILNRIAIEDKIHGTDSKIERLTALLKEDKNRQFLDQIYYEIANTYLLHNEGDKAIENYNTAVKSSINNVEQKGLAYLGLADIYFRQGEYVQSKSYYDSTLLNLTADYPEYEQIKKKRDNLDLLSDRLTVIAREDTLQMLAGLPEEERKARIGALARAQVQEAFSQPGLNSIPGSPFQDNGTRAAGPTDGKFYFDNAIAIGQGFSDFKRRWGNRKLEDNWRRSQRSASEVTNAASVAALNPDNVVTGTPVNSGPAKTAEDVQLLLQDIPLNAEQKAASDRRIASAYFDIGNFYKDILNEPAEAIKAYEELLRRYPEPENKLAVYYNLYRLYDGVNARRSEEYKNKLLTGYPDSPFAKAITDPNYMQAADEELQAVTHFYEGMYDAYLHKKYADVILKAAEADKKFAKSTLSPQISYLAALAVGHTQKLPAFEQVLKTIESAYPDDKLIVPLVQQHLLYIIANRPELDSRQTALLDYDPAAPRFIDEPETEVAVAPNPVATDPVKAADPAQAGVKQPVAVNTAPEQDKEAAKEPSMFNIADTAVHYFVVNVADARVNLNSSRFGIGQFNRANFSGNSIKHQLKVVNNQNQLIFVGEFRSKDTAMQYYENISPLMKNIMKIPAAKYSTFIITKENLDKLNDRPAIEKYIEFYQKNY